MKDYIHRNLVAWDQAIAAALQWGLPGETISARAWKSRQNGHLFGCILCRLLETFWPDHCRKARDNDIKRAEAVIADLQ